MMMDSRLARWFGSGDTGISSEAIALWLGAGEKLERWGDGTPSDGADFGRCYRLMKAIPEFRERVGEMAGYGGKWPTLVKYWNEIEALYEREISDPKKHSGITYKRMRAIEIEAYEAMGWTVTRYPDGSMSSASPPPPAGADDGIA